MQEGDFIHDYSLSNQSKAALWIGSFLLVAFGQPLWSWWGGLLSAGFGFALIWRMLLSVTDKRKRFFVAAGWYAAVQTVQLAWMASHPYLYIYAVILFCADLTGLQFGLISLLINPKKLFSLSRILAIASLWALLEWSRLFWLSGLSFNPIGLSLSGSIYPLQFASLGGIYLLSFWVILTNLFALRSWKQNFHAASLLSWGAIALMPYLFGFAHLHFHRYQQANEPSNKISTLLVQTGFPVEESIGFRSAEEARAHVLGEWKQILSILHPHADRSVDLIIFPECVVPYGTYSPIFPVREVLPMFKNLFDWEKLAALPPLEEPYAAYLETSKGPDWLLTNAFFAQALANLFKADVVIGLEDHVWVAPEVSEAYSAAFHFPQSNQEAKRYEKQVLVPMGEYIPFSFCRDLAAQYGIRGSFTSGQEAQVFQGKIPFSPSICYEETYGHLMRQGRLKGAEIFVNLTSDAWFPDSYLPQQHFDHARLRTVENGVPLIRSCNTGVTGVVDSLGQTVQVLGEDSLTSQWLSKALYVEVPTYHYATLYSQVGDTLLLLFCIACVGWEGYQIFRRRSF